MPRRETARRSSVCPTLRFLLLLTACGLLGKAADAEPHGSQFVGLKDFSRFARSAGPLGEIILTSPILVTRTEWDELVVTWNVDLTASGGLKVEARGGYSNQLTKFYVMGLWSPDPATHPRASVRDQKDADGDVLTDTLKLGRPTREVQLRLTLAGEGAAVKWLKFVGLSFRDSRKPGSPQAPSRRAWGKALAVPERSQMLYPGGEVWCSPTTVSMLLSHWSAKLGRPDLEHDVPAVARAVYDPNWPGTGNWPFNTAYAGAFRGMRAYVSRFTDVSELEDWIASGIPVGVSVSYNLLRGKSTAGGGHLVVCVGFTKDGDVIVNDPGTKENVRKTFPRESLIKAWAYSQNTVYLIYPEETRLPRDRFGHWDSTASRRLWSWETRGQKP